MTKLRLILTDTIALATNTINGFPLVYNQPSGDPVPTPPAGHKYVPEIAYPASPPADGKIWVRNLTIDEYGWVEADAQPEWLEVAAWRIRAVAKNTTHGAGTLMEAIDAEIAAIVDPLENAVAYEAFYGGNTMERDSTLLNTMAAQMGLTDPEIDALFQQAFAIEV